MISWLRRFNVTTRIMSLSVFFVFVMMAELSFFTFQLEALKISSELQQEKVLEETERLAEESKQLKVRSEIQLILKQSQKIQKTFADMLFLYFDGIVTEYYESLNGASVAADSLESQLKNLSTETEAAVQVTNILSTLSEYREYMDSAVNYYQKGKVNLAQSEIGDANIEAKKLNDELSALNMIFQNRLNVADASVVDSLQKTLEASDVVNQLSVNAGKQIEDDQGLIWLMLLLTLRIIIEGKDEISDMSEATQNLLGKLRLTLEDVGNLAVDLESAANEGHQASINTYKQSTQQQVQSEGIAAAATQLGASSEDISRTTGEGLLLVENVTKSADEGQKNVQATAENMDRLADQFDAVESTVSELVKHSTNIGQVLDVIRSIAEQTNLLALNAAIEAARAGDQGRGFAVVADEVRTLAQRTSESTNEIQTMVEALQKFSTIAASSITANREQVDHSVQLSDQAKASLTKIVEELSLLTKANKNIANITSEQQQAVLEVDENVQKVRLLALNVEEQAKDSTNVSLSLKEMASKLQQQLMAFKH
ncbi:MAG: hypothetical protein OFPII_20150 [Osedax symbiont Rs1]|nr:MAG: hypothetical protein OFPII_20150 [Osedax symbiont Rs1]